MRRHAHLGAALAILALAQAVPAAHAMTPEPSAPTGPEPATPARKLTGKSLRRFEKKERRAAAALGTEGESK